MTALDRIETAFIAFLQVADDQALDLESARQVLVSVCRSSGMRDDADAATFARKALAKAGRY